MGALTLPPGHSNPMSWVVDRWKLGACLELQAAVRVLAGRVGQAEDP